MRNLPKARDLSFPQELGFFDVTKTGEITSRLSADTTKMSDNLQVRNARCL